MGATLGMQVAAQPSSSGVTRESPPPRATAAGAERDADAIVAVVNKEIITRRELEARVRAALG